MSEWLTVDGASEYLGLSQSRLYQLAQQGRIPAHKVGKQWRFNRADLDAWVRLCVPTEEFFLNASAHIEDNMLLRDPQREAHNAVRAYFDSGGQKAIVQLPVGCGKSGLIAVLPFGMARGRVLVIAPNLTIRDELYRALDITNKRDCFWRKCSVLPAEAMLAGPYVAVLDGRNANMADCDRSHVTLTNIQQLASSADRWLPAFPDGYFDLILVDEGHHSAAPSWQSVFERFPEARVVSLTATPFRSDRKELDGKLVYRYPFKRAMIKGYIKKLHAVYVAPEEIHFTYRDDAHHHTLEEVLELKEEEWFSTGVAMAPECNEHIVDASLDRLEQMRQSGTNHQLIAVAMSVDHAKAVRSLYAERGYEAAVIHTYMASDKREEVIQRLRAGLVDCVVQVQMLGEGFDHPHLSVAAVFRPFRSLPPYVQFVGRIMRVVVQNDPRHPDNYGHVVSHVGLNLDQLVENFRDMERDDLDYFQELISGAEPEAAMDVREGRARMRLRPDMVVDHELVSEFFEEDFLASDDAVLLEDLKEHAEALGFDPSELADALLKARRPSRRTIQATAPFPVQPQMRRREARRRLVEEERRAAKLLLNRLGLQPGGSELSFKIMPGAATGANLPAAVMLVNAKTNRYLQIERGQRGKLATEEFIKARDHLPQILDELTRQAKARMNANE